MDVKTTALIAIQVDYLLSDIDLGLEKIQKATITNTDYAEFVRIALQSDKDVSKILKQLEQHPSKDVQAISGIMKWGLRNRTTKISH